MICVLTILAAVVGLAVSVAPASAVNRHVEHPAGGLFPALDSPDATRRPYPLSERPRPVQVPKRPIK